MAIDTPQQLTDKLDSAIKNAKAINDQIQAAARKLPAEVPMAQPVPTALPGQK